MTRVLLILALVLTAFWVYTIVDCAVQPGNRHRGVSKPVWILIVILIPVLGGLLWLAVGRVRAASISARRAPDDDPEFLGKIGTVSDQDERIRRLEEELALLDAEDDDPRWDVPVDGSHPPLPPSTAPSATPAAEPPQRSPERPSDEDDGRGQRGVVN